MSERRPRGFKASKSRSPGTALKAYSQFREIDVFIYMFYLFFNIFLLIILFLLIYINICIYIYIYLSL